MAALAGTSLAQASDAAYCSAYQSSLFGELIAGVPTTPAAILSYATQFPLPTTLDFQAHATQLCDILGALPTSLLPEFKSFASELLEYGASYQSEFVGYVTACEPEDEVASMTSALASYFTATGNLCPTPTPAPTSGGAANGTYPTYSNSPAPTAAPTTTTTPIATAAAARPTGVLMGAAAMGGIVGAAALL